MSGCHRTELSTDFRIRLFEAVHDPRITDQESPVAPMTTPRPAHGRAEGRRDIRSRPLGEGFMLCSIREENRDVIVGQGRRRLRRLGASTLTGLMLASILGAHQATAATPEHSSVVSNRQAAEHLERIEVDASVLDAAVARAESAGVQLTREDVRPQTVGNDAVGDARKDIQTSYRDQAQSLDAAAQRLQDARKAHEAKVAEADADYRRQMEAYSRDEAAYDRDKEKYDQDKARYDALLKEQITDANPDVALAPGKLIHEQPFVISENRNSLVRVDGIDNEPGQNNMFDAHNNYNSDSVTHVRPKDGSNFTVFYRDVARDKATGRSLNARIQVSDIVTSTKNPGEPAIEVFSNYSDNLALYNVTAAKQTVTFSYADNGEDYRNNYYVSFGSLNGQHREGTARYEYAQGVYTAADQGVIATFVNPESEISRQAQPVHGSASQAVRNAFMLPHGDNQSRPITDTEREIMTKLGVTFLARNGSSFWVGTSGAEGRDPDDVGAVSATYNHVMLSSDTVAPTESMPVAPTPPKPPTRQDVPPLEPVRATVRYHQLFTPSSGTEKIAHGEGKFVLPGQTTHQTVTQRTGFERLKQFVVGDNIFAAADGRIPVSVDLASVTVTAGEKDVTEGFRLVREETEFQGKKVLQVRAEAKDPKALPQKTAITLHVSQTALDDGVADDEVDAGFAIVNGRLIHTEPHVYHEPSVTPHKHGARPKGGGDIAGKTVAVGDVIRYVLSLDASQLADTVETVTRFGVVDDYDEAHGRVDMAGIRIHKVPAGTDGADLKALEGALGSGAEDVTAHFDLEDKGAEGLSIMAKSQNGRPVPPLGFTYVVSLPYVVTANVDGDIRNTAWQIVNDHRTQTETVPNPVKRISPHKDVVVSAADDSSLDGREISLNQEFTYRLDSSIRPAQYAGHTSEWSMVDDYDESHDRYDGKFVVRAKTGFVREDGSRVAAGEDITRYFTQTVDERSGSVTYSATDEFLTIMDLEANRNTEQAWSVYVQMTRIGTGDVEKVFTESYNGTRQASNRVRTHTPKPPQPDQPPTPQPAPPASEPPAEPASPDAHDPAPQPGSPDAEPSSPAPESSHRPKDVSAVPAAHARGKGATAHTGNTEAGGIDPMLGIGLGLGSAVLAGSAMYRGRHRRQDSPGPARGDDRTS